MTKNISHTGMNFIKYLVITSTFIFIYNLIVYFFSPVASNNLHVIITEAPILLLILYFLYFPKIENTIVKYIFPVLPLIFLYISFDIFYSFLARPPRYSDLQNIFLVFEFIPLIGIGIIVSISLFFIVIFVLFFNTYKKAGFSLNFFLNKLIVLILLFFSINSGIFTHYNRSHGQTIKYNGRISSFVNYSKLEIENKKKLLQSDFSNINIIETLYYDTIKNPRNIHLIVLESFINPNYFQNIKYSSNPLSEEIKPYLINNKTFSKVKSPVYGGQTAQAEFEVLTGLKAYAKIESIEFNIMNGGIINSFIKQLSNSNYNTYATIATDANCFNSKLAYKSLGFENVEFLEESSDFSKSDGDAVIFDGDLFEHNIEFLDKYYKSNSKPIFNYILGIYGHVPFKLNPEKRPLKVKLRNSNNKSIERIANQFYYRTKALAKHIKELQIRDPNGIIYVTSDHLPPIFSNNIKYKYNNKINISLLIKEGIPYDVSGKNYFEITWLIWDILAKKENKRKINEKLMEQLYYTALKESFEK